MWPALCLRPAVCVCLNVWQSQWQRRVLKRAKYLNRRLHLQLGVAIRNAHLAMAENRLAIKAQRALRPIASWAKQKANYIIQQKIL